jgi:N4-(beta-N-acetylglucosaminyl)-L-asparaginase
LDKHENGGGGAIVAVESGASKCEELSCDFTVGFGGSPDENGETTLDAMIMDGDTMEVGAVASLRHIKQAVTASRLVKDHTSHSLLAGLQASQFAQLMGLEPANLTTEHSAKLHSDWLDANCQPNFRKNVSPDPAKHCGPYHPVLLPPLPEDLLLDGIETHTTSSQSTLLNLHNKNDLKLQNLPTSAHDTISLVALDSHGSMASACSTNGAINKVPGRVGDGAIPGGGSYVDSEVGGCGATGDGDVHIRFLPCYQVVENMRNGMGPREAAEDAIYRIVSKLKRNRRRGGGGVENLSSDIDYTGAVIALSKDGRHGAASYGWNFSYSYRSEDSDGVQIVHVKPLEI